MTAVSIETTKFDGLAAVEVATATARMVLVSEVGPRVAHFGAADGRNLLYWDRERRHGRNDWLLYGGHRVWTTRPGADEAEETYAADNRPCQVRRTHDAVTVTAPGLPELMVRKSIHVRVLDDATFAVEDRIENVGDMLWSGGVWGLTCTLPHEGTTYGVPLGDGSDWDVFDIVIPRRWGGHTSRVNDPQIAFTEECLLLDPRGVEAKRMVLAPQGLIGMTDAEENLSFIKKTSYRREGQYPRNTNIAIYLGPGNFMVEMETMGPEATVKPGETLVSEELWALRPAVDWRAYTIGSIDL